MSWTTLNDVLQLNTTPITIVDRLHYKQIAVRPYPHEPVLKAMKNGLEFPHKQQKMLQAGQFIISRLHVHRKLWGIVPRDLDGAVVNSNFLIFDLYPDLDPGYFAAYLSTPFFRQAAFAACNKRSLLSIRRFFKIPFSLPPLEQQYRVAELWALAHTALENTAEMFASIEAIKAGVMDDLFRNGNSAWERKKLETCAIIGSDIAVNYALSVVPPGRVVLGTGLLDDGGIGITPDHELDNLFLFYYLENQKLLLRANFGSRLENTLRSLPIALPTLYEQRKFAALIQQHDEALLRLRIEQTALRRLVQGVFHQIFSGTLDVEDALPLLRTGFIQ